MPVMKGSYALHHDRCAKRHNANWDDRYSTLHA
jgi:hypothetical protein